MSLTVGSLFAGIGGFDLAAERVGFQVKWQVEIDDYATRVLEKHWPGVKRFRDVRECVGYRREEFGYIDAHAASYLLDPVDVICGGFPCQPVSLAGARRAQSDERWMWPHFARIIGELRPRYVVVENVPGLLTAGFDDVLGGLAALGMDAEWESIPALAVGAKHRRERIWVVAYPSGSGLEERGVFAGGRGRTRGAFAGQDAVMAGDVSNASCWGHLDGCGCAAWWATEPDVGRVVARLPAWVDGGRLDGAAAEGGTGEILRAMQRSDGASSLQWTTRGLVGLPAAEILLAAVCEYEGPPKSLGNLSLAGSAASEVVMRGLWFNGKTACPPCRRTAEEQRRREYPDPLHVVSRLLACDCRSAWLDPAGTTSNTSRVNRLRGLGNAIVPQVAEWIFQRIAEAEAETPNQREGEVG